MRRYGYIIKEAAEEVNLIASFDYVLRGTKRKTSRSGRYLLEHKKEVIARLQKELLEGTFQLGKYHERVIKEGIKMRTIQCIPLEKRIAINSVMTSVEKRLHKTFIADTAASIKGRGGLYLFHRIEKFIKDNPEYRWFYKCDISKFYPSIDQGIMKTLIRSKFKDKLLIDILDQCIEMLPSGISIGLRSSQVLANFLISVYIDHVLKDKKRVKGFWRYCDDMVIAGKSKKELEDIIKVIHNGVESAKLAIKSNEQVFSIDDRPLDFLGYRLFGNGKVLVRKRIKKNFAKRWKKVVSKRRRIELIGSFFGITKHCDAHHLFKKLTGIDMKDFSELGLNYESANGKKIFQCNTIHLNELQNRQFVVKDYETDIKTKQGEGRYVVLIELDGREYKFFTNSDELKQMLDKAKSIDEIPFRCTLKRLCIGDNKYKYSFA